MELKVNLKETIARYVYSVYTDDVGYYDNHINIGEIFDMLGLNLDKNISKEDEAYDDEKFALYKKCNDMILQLKSPETVEADVTICIYSIYNIVLDNMSYEDDRLIVREG